MQPLSPLTQVSPLAPSLAFPHTSWFFFFPRPSALSNDMGATNTPLCSGSFILLLLLMPKDSLAPTWGQSFYPLFSLTALASPACAGVPHPLKCVAHAVVSTSLPPPTSSDPSCLFPEQTKQGWVVLKHLCAYPAFSTAPTLGGSNEQDRQRHACLELRLVQIVF